MKSFRNRAHAACIFAKEYYPSRQCCVSYTEARLNILWGGRCNLMAHKNA